ncbi:MAG: hypothetical protein KAI73_05055 [Rhodospirillaceae bacterium]|nr:hypothetical protein [Rhodospirillaceae bacterium]
MALAPTTVAANAIPTGLLGSEDALRRALSGALTGVEAGAVRGTRTLRPFTRGGAQAFELQTALSGAGGAPAQAQAFEEFTASPGQQFLRDAAERALLRNEAAIGGLGGGRVRTALQEQGVGLAAQDFGEQFGRLGQVAGLGGQLAGQQAGLEFGEGRDVGQLAFQTGQTLASGRTRAGEQIAGQIGGTTSALANLAAQQGQGLADIFGAGGGNLANLLSAAGREQGLSGQQLATLLANISTGSAAQVAGLPGIPGIQQTESKLGDIGKLVTAFGTL